MTTKAMALLIIGTATGLCVPSQAANAPEPFLPYPPQLTTNVISNPTLRWQLKPINVLENGGFETGQLDPWEVFSSGFGGAQINDGGGFFGPEPDTPPLSGNFGLTFQGVNPDFIGRSISFAIQTITIPSNVSTVTLRWSDLINNYANGGAFQNNNDAHQFVVGVLDGTDDTLLALPFITEPGYPAFNDWTKRKADLTDLRGQTIRLVFQINTSLGWLFVHVDDIRLELGVTDMVNSDLFLSTLPAVTIDDLQGTTSDFSWNLNNLAPNTDYYWKVVTSFDGASFSGPTWSFKTSPLGAIDHFQWTPINSSPASESPFSVNVTAKDAHNFTLTNFSDSVSLSAAAHSVGTTTYNLLTDQPFTALSAFDRSTIGYSFTPSQDLLVSAVRSFSGDKISIWTDSGILLRSQTVSSLSTSWNNTPLDQPILLLAGEAYRVSVFGNNITTHYARFDNAPFFAHGTINQSYETSGDGFPSSPHPAQWWYVDLVYSINTAQPIPVSPGISGIFSNGTWTGDISLMSDPASQVILQAESSDGTTGASSPFVLSMALADRDNDGMPDDFEITFGLNPDDPSDADEDLDEDDQSNLSEYLSGNDPSDPDNSLKILAITHATGTVTFQFTAIANRSYTIQYADNLTPAIWNKLTDVSSETTDRTIMIPDATGGNQLRFYRLVTPQQP